MKQSYVGYSSLGQGADGRKCQLPQLIQNQINLLEIPPYPIRPCVYFVDALNNPHELHLSACEKTEVG
jgi:hypothetical protein